MMNERCTLLTVLVAKRITIANDNVRHIPARDVLIGTSIAACHIGSLTQELQGELTYGVVAIGKDYCFYLIHCFCINFFQFTHPKAAMIA